MFTGIIEKRGRVQSVRTRGKLKEVVLKTPAGWKLKTGQSISVDGVCSTVVLHSATVFAVDYMPETLRNTTVGSFAPGSVVNLERSLKYGDRMDGHMVQGHVEGVARVGKIEKEGRSRKLTLKLPVGLARYTVKRGSIALNGVSLTIARMHGSLVTVALVPHTLKETTLSTLTIGDFVNVETDIMARHHLLMKNRATVRPHARKPLRKGR